MSTLHFTPKITSRLPGVSKNTKHGVPLVALSLFLTACGSSGSDSVASTVQSATQPAGQTAPNGTNQPSNNGIITGNVIDNGSTPSESTDQNTPANDEGQVVVSNPVQPTTPTTPAAIETEETAPPVAVEEPVAPVITSTRVTFEITVPSYTSEELQLDVFWGDNELQAGWVVDENWTVSDVLPANSESELRVVFYDHFGSTTLATFDSSLEIFDQETQTFTVSANEFDSDRWDNDADEVSNLDELRLGTDPDFAEIVGAPTEPANVTSIEYSGYDLELFWPRGSDEDGVVIGYDIFRDDEQITDRLDALSFYDGSVQPETEYTYDIYSVDNDELRSRAATILITTPADEPLSGVEANRATLSGGGDSSWFISDGITTTSDSWTSGSCSYSEGAASGIGISDARLTNQGDAFDFGSLMWVNGEQVGAFLRSATDSTTNFASVPMAGLQVHTEYHAISSLPVLRNYTSFTNEGDEDIFVVINVASNFGADNGNRIITTSGGDTTFGVDDRWVITEDFSSDPTNTTVFYGPDSPASTAVFTADSVFNCFGSEGLTARIDVTVPAGETRALMLFHGMSTTISNARSLATEFDVTPTLSSSLTEGMTEVQLSNVVNWAY